MNASGWRKLNAGLLELFAPGLTAASYSERAFGFLGGLVSHDASCFARHDPKSGQLYIEHNVDSADFDRALGAFGRHMAKYPLFRFDPAVNGGRPFSRADFFSRREFRDLDIYAEGFGSVGLMDHFALHVPTRDDTVVFFGLERGGARDYSAGERELLELAQPHLANAWNLAEARGHEAAQPVEPGFFIRFGLSPRQSEVLFWLTEGKSNVEIAHVLHLGLSTVKGYVGSIFDALGVDNRLAATLAAIELIRKFRDGSASARSVLVSTAART